MKQAFAGHLVPSAEQVLETMFFTGVVSSGEPCVPGCPEMITRSVAFEGPPDGQLCVGVMPQTAAALASSFLGLDPENVTLPDCEQIAEELANMICGSVLSRCAPASSFQLHITSESACTRHCEFCVALELPEGALNICAQVDRL